MKRNSVVVIVMLVVGALGACKESSGSKSGGTKRSSGSPSQGSGATTAVTAPALPAALPGFVPDGPVVHGAAHVTGRDPGALVPGFPVATDNCAARAFTVRWHVDSDVTITAEMASAPPPIHLELGRQYLAERASVLQGDGCAQPVFFGPPATNVDVAVDYQAWKTAA